jgi:uncharacterized membrane protein YqjE
MAARSAVIDRIEPERSTGQIIRDVLNDVQEMIHAEVLLAKAELGEKAQRARMAGALAGGGAVCGLFAAACLIAGCIAALALVMPLWLAALAMSVVLGAVALALLGAAFSRWRKFNPVPERAVQTVKDEVEWARKRTS